MVPGAYLEVVRRMIRLPAPVSATALLLMLSASCESQRTTGDPDAAANAAVVTASDSARASADATIRSAAEALAGGRAWDATRLLFPLVRDDRAAGAPPLVVVLAAQAAAGWGGWDEATRILGAGAWRGTAFAGEGHELLARHALQRNDGSTAVQQADSAVRTAGRAPSRGVRLTLLARALDRTGERDSAAATYARAAELVPQAADWLRLRAAGVLGSASARERLYDDIEHAVAKARVPWTEAIALEAGGDPRGAARLYDSLDARPQALRLRLALDTAGPARAALRTQAFALLATPRDNEEWRRTLDLVDSSFAVRTPVEELQVARGASRRGSAARAVAAYAKAAAGGASMTAQDHYDYGIALTGAGRWRDAAGRFAQVGSASPLAGRAAYQRARAQLRSGSGAAARTALRAVVSQHANDATAASSALYLLADLATDDGRDAAARAAWRELVARYPRSALAGPSAFKAALIAYLAGDDRAAAAEWDAAAAAYPGGSEAVASRYWAGRAYARRGDAANARARWQAVMQGSPTSYYAVLAARRLGVAPWTPPPADDTPPAVGRVDSAMARMAMLDSLGMAVEAGHERTALLAGIEGNRDALLAAGAGLRAAGQSSRAIALGLEAVDAGATDARAYRLVYPLLHREALLAASARARLDPALVAALVRQESSFNPRAVSPVGARGLMQLMPPVGRSIARAKRYPLWDDALLLEPTVSFDLGTTHLAGDLRRHRDLTRALAAYNAGASRVVRWAARRGVADPEVFAERIPYVETRDYVRIVQRNLVMYRALYDLQ